jgi:hypothetical protein
MRRCLVGLGRDSPHVTRTSPQQLAKIFGSTTSLLKLPEFYSHHFWVVMVALSLSTVPQAIHVRLNREAPDAPSH